jgi:hypothetical protein
MWRQLCGRTGFINLDCEKSLRGVSPLRWRLPAGEAATCRGLPASPTPAPTTGTVPDVPLSYYAVHRTSHAPHCSAFATARHCWKRRLRRISAAILRRVRIGSPARLGRPTGPPYFLTHMADPITSPDAACAGRFDNLHPEQPAAVSSQRLSISGRNGLLPRPRYEAPASAFTTAECEFRQARSAAGMKQT